MIESAGGEIHPPFFVVLFPSRRSCLTILLIVARGSVVELDVRQPSCSNPHNSPPTAPRNGATSDARRAGIPRQARNDDPAD